MANHPSAKKRARQTVVRTERNRSIRTRVKNATRAFREALASGDKAAAAAKLAEATRILRKSASQGVLHKATASRRVSRLVKALHQADAS